MKAPPAISSFPVQEWKLISNKKKRKKKKESDRRWEEEGILMLVHQPFKGIEFMTFFLFAFYNCTHRFIEEVTLANRQIKITKNRKKKKESEERN